MEKLPVHATEATKSVSHKDWRSKIAVLVCGVALIHLIFNFQPQPWTLLSSVPRIVRPCHHHDASPPSLHQSVNWTPCEANSTYSCGYIRVPKDHFNSSVGHADIAIMKVPATAPKHLRLGGIFINPGGPGGSGFLFPLRVGDPLRKLFDGRYDIIGFDPRGIGKTKPLVECFDSTLDYEIFKSGTVLERSFDIAPDPFSTIGQQRLHSQNLELLALQKTAFARCQEKMGDELLYMSTSTVVRDIDFMSTVLYGLKAPINFIGYSYGTVLGAFLVNMLPKERIGKVIVDGVMSTPEYVNDRPEKWLMKDMKYTDDAFDWFLRDCFKAGPAGCALSKEGDKDPQRIAQRLDEFLDDLYAGPMPVPYASRPGVLNSGGARAILYQVTNRPNRWVEFATMFAEAMAGNATLLFNALAPPLHTKDLKSKFNYDMSRVAVTCTDIRPYKDESEHPTANELVEATNEVLRSLSMRFGASVNVLEPDGGCQYWGAAGKTKERFTGPFNATLNLPMLITSNTNDPITPLSSGQELNRNMGASSRLVIQNSPGHCSGGSVSVCTSTVWKKYFLNGTVPENGVMCEVDQGYFPTSEKLSAEGRTGEETELALISREIAAAFNDWEDLKW